jgi:RNA polymerase sigma-70 factor, ECF subfamily
MSGFGRLGEPVGTQVSSMNPLESVAASFLSDRHRLMSYLLAAVRDPHTAEDMLQEIWLRLAADTATGTHIEDQAAWCRGIARNLLLHHWRRSRLEQHTLNAAYEEVLWGIETALTEDPAGTRLVTDEQAALTECLVRLPDASREIIRLRYEIGFSLEEMSQQLGKTLAAITKALSRLRAGLAACVKTRRLREPALWSFHKPQHNTHSIPLSPARQKKAK